MSVNGVEIKVGQVWRSRCGDEWRIDSPFDQFCGWDWQATKVHGPHCGIQSSFTDAGTYWPKQSPSNNGTCPNDLVFLVSDPQVGVERRKRQTDNSPLRRKEDYPPVPDHIPDLAASPEDFVASVPGALDVSEVLTVADSNAQATMEQVRHRIISESSIPVGVECAPGTVNLTHYEEAELSRMLADSLVNGTVVAEPAGNPQSALDVQVGGGHYKQFAIQPVEFIHKNGIPFIEGNCIKYLCRWRDKGGVQDLEKVKHYLDLLIEMETKK